MSALAIATDALIEQGQGSIPTPFLVVLVLWLAIIFAGFGLVSAKNATVVTTFFCARYRSPARSF